MRKKTLNPTFGIMLGLSIHALVIITLNAAAGMYVAALINFLFGAFVYCIPFLVFSYMRKGTRIGIQTWEHKDHGGPFPMWIWIYFVSIGATLLFTGMILGADYQLFFEITYSSLAISIGFGVIIAITIWNIFFLQIAESLYGKGRTVYLKNDNMTFI